MTTEDGIASLKLAMTGARNTWEFKTEMHRESILFIDPLIHQGGNEMFQTTPCVRFKPDAGGS
jgi:hypothetical protein